MSANFLNENVPDPTDFPLQTIAPGLRKLDATFRCSICGDTYDAPVTLGCGHCFCSGCLRPALALKQECPACRKGANEGHIRPNYGMEEAISAWNESRPYILALIERTQNPPSSRTESSPRKRKRQRSESSSSIEVVDRARWSSKSNSKPQSDSSFNTNVAKGKAKASDLNDIPSSDVDEQEISPRPEVSVKCPLCTKSVQFQDLNPHMDRDCQDPPKETASETWLKIMQSKAKAKVKVKGKQTKNSHSDSDDEAPLPKVSYATLREKQIKDLLHQHGLPVHGDRSQLEQRHQKWVMLYNGNLDRSMSKRKTQANLRQELKKWEDLTLSKRKKVVVENAKEHVKLHKSEFDRLIKLARPEKQTTSSSPTPVSTSASPQPVSPRKEPSARRALSSEASDDPIVIDK